MVSERVSIAAGDDDGDDGDDHDEQGSVRLRLEGCRSASCCFSIERSQQHGSNYSPSETEARRRMTVSISVLAAGVGGCALVVVVTDGGGGGDFACLISVVVLVVGIPAVVDGMHCCNDLRVVSWPSWTDHHSRDWRVDSGVYIANYWTQGRAGKITHAAFFVVRCRFALSSRSSLLFQSPSLSSLPFHVLLTSR